MKEFIIQLLPRFINGVVVNSNSNKKIIMMICDLYIYKYLLLRNFIKFNKNFIWMPGKKGGTAKPSDMLKKKDKDYDEVWK